MSLTMEAVGEQGSADVSAEDATTAAGTGVSGMFRELARPSRIDRYRILRELGRGGLGVVYLAYDPQLDRKVALKLLVAAAGDPEFARASTFREAQAVARISHPNVVNVFDVGEPVEGVYLAMEYVSGLTLAQWLHQHPSAPVRQVLGLFLQAGRGLAAAHRCGITHRDFKPANAIVGDDGRVRVLDFGLARAQQEHAPGFEGGDAASDETLYSSTVGTPAYMAPEQSEGGAVGPAADQFAFCVSLWEALAGSRPLPTDKDARLAAIREARFAEESSGAWMPRRIRNALLRGLAYDPAQRWESMEALLQRLGDGRRRRVTLGVFTAAWLAGGLAFALGGFGESTSSECQAGQDLRAAWHRARGDVVGSLAAIEVPYAQDTATRVEQHVTDWIDRWVDAYRSSCVAAKERGDLSARRYEAIYACLDERRHQLHTRLQILREPTQTTAQNAVQMVAALDAPELCARAAQDDLERSVHRGQDEDARALWEAIDAESAELAAGDRDGRVDVLGSLRDQALASGHADLAALAAAALAMARRWSGEHDGAQDDFENAIHWALEADDHRLAATSISHFAYGLEYEGQASSALRWLRLARTLAEKAGPDVSLARTLDIAEAEFLLASGRASEALEFATRAADRDGTPAIGDEEGVRILADQIVGRVLHKLGRVDEAVARAEDAASRTAELIGDQHPMYAKALRFVAVFKLDAGSHREAYRTLEQAEAIDDAAGVKHAPGVLLLQYSNLGECLVRSGDYSGALAWTQRAQDLVAVGKLQPNPEVAYGLYVHGRALHGADRLEEAHSALRRCVEISERVGVQTRADFVFRALALAQVLLERGDSDEAQQVLDELRSDVPTGTQAMFDVLQALLQAERGDVDEARAALRDAWPRAHRRGSATHWMRRAAQWGERRGLELATPARATDD